MITISARALRSWLHAYALGTACGWFLCLRSARALPAKGFIPLYCELQGNLSKAGSDWWIILRNSWLLCPNSRVHHTWFDSCHANISPHFPEMMQKYLGNPLGKTGLTQNTDELAAHILFYFFLVSENLISSASPVLLSLELIRVVRMMKLVFPSISKLLFRYPAASGGLVLCHTSLDL